MTSNSIVGVLIGRDGLNLSDAVQRLERAKAIAQEMLDEGCDPEELIELLEDEFGLESDYVMELV